MSGFSAAWLALREPADAAARSAALASFAMSGLETAALRILDLGGGTGANIRYLSPRLRSPQHWTLVDNDPALLQRAPAFAETHSADLNAVVNDNTLFEGCRLVTASALLDLRSLNRDLAAAAGRADGLCCPRRTVRGNRRRNAPCGARLAFLPPCPCNRRPSRSARHGEGH